MSEPTPLEQVRAELQEAYPDGLPVMHNGRQLFLRGEENRRALIRLAVRELAMRKSRAEWLASKAAWLADVTPADETRPTLAEMWRALRRVIRNDRPRPIPPAPRPADIGDSSINGT